MPLSVSSQRMVVTQRDHLTLQTWTAPPPAARQVRVRVLYSAISYGDVMLRRHVFRKRPAVPVPGYEVVGEVEAVGEGVSAWRPGALVVAYVELGGNARHALVPASNLVALPEGVDPVVAAAVVLNYATALGMFRCAALKPKDSFVIDGASGGVGSATLDVARSQGLRALGTTRRPDQDLFGAPLFDARSPQLAQQIREASGGGVAAVFDSRAGLGIWRSWSMLRRGGALVVFGLSSIASQRGARATLSLAGTFASLGLMKLWPGKRHNIFAIDRVFPRHPEQVKAWVQASLALLARGEVAPLVDDCVPLEKLLQAHQRIERGDARGKIVVDCR